MRCRWRPKTRTSRSSLNRPVPGLGSGTTLLAYACECARPVRRREWATSDEIVDAPVGDPVAGRTRGSEARAEARARTEAAGPAVVAPGLRDAPARQSRRTRIPELDALAGLVAQTVGSCRRSVITTLILLVGDIDGNGLIFSLRLGFFSLKVKW